MFVNATKLLTFIELQDQQCNIHGVYFLTYHSEISHCFTIEIKAISTNLNINEFLGQPITINRYTDSSKTNVNNYYHGYVTEINQLDYSDQLKQAQISMTLRPWLWLLSYTKQFRVFQDKTTKEIIDEIFKKAGFSDKYSLNGFPSTKREYCVQYNETDLDFVERLIAEEGFIYFFEQNKNDHHLIIQDPKSQFSFADTKQYDYINKKSGSNPIIYNWKNQLNFHAKNIELTNYDYEQTLKITSSPKSSSHDIANNNSLSYKYFPYPSISKDMSDLKDNLIDRRLGQQEQNYNLILASTQNDSVILGKCFSLANHTDPKQQGDYLVITIQTQYQLDDNNIPQVNVDFTAIKKSIPFYAKLKHKPKMMGLQSAIVTGAEKDQPCHDEQGRVRICFQWDDEDPNNKTSCYTRVAQLQAGTESACQFIPRAHQEVLVNFIDGDPDQPIIIGTVYNSHHPLPYAESSKSGIKTKLNGLANELVFDDQQDEESIYIHAAKDLTIEVENDSASTINGSLIEEISKDKKINVEEHYELTADRHIEQKSNHIKLEADTQITLQVGKSKIHITSDKIKLHANNIEINANNKLIEKAVDFDSSISMSSNFSAKTIKLDAAVQSKIQSKIIELNAEVNLSAHGKLSAKLSSDLITSVSSSTLTEVKGLIVKVN